MNDRAGHHADKEPLPIPKTKWRPGCLTYAVATFILLAGLTWCGIWLWTRSARLAYEAELAAIADRGEPISFADYKPDPLPGELDGTADYLRALRGLQQYMEQDTPVVQKLIEMNSRLQPATFPVIAQYTAEDLANIRVMLDEIRELRSSLRLALNQEIRLDVDYGTYDGALDYEMADTEARSLWSHVLASAGYLEISDGDADQAITAVEEILKLSAPRTHVTLVGRQLRSTGYGYQGRELAVGLLEHLDLSPEQRARLDQQLARAENQFRLRPASMANRAVLLSAFANIRPVLDDAGALEQMGIGGIDGWLYANFRAIQYDDLTTAVRMATRGLEFVDQEGPEGQLAADRYSQDIAALPQRAVLTNLMVTNAASVREAGMSYRQQLRGLRLALRVDAYYRRTGQMPAHLADVLSEIPEAILPEIPRGTLSGQPAAFETTEAGFVIFDAADRSRTAVEIKYPVNPMAAIESEGG